MKKFKEDIFCIFRGNEKYQGNINIDSKIELTLIGCLDFSNDIDVLYCETLTGKKITLCDCYISTRKMSMPGYPLIIISANYCFFGEHLLAEDIKFKEASLTISGVDKWVNINGFHTQSEEDLLTLKYEKPKEIELYNSELVRFSFRFELEIPSYQVENITMSQKTLIHINHEETFSLNSFWKYLSFIKSFFTLSYYSEPEISNINFKIGEKEINFRYLG